MCTEAFWLDFLSNFFATILGIALGLPIALWLDRVARKKSEREKKAETVRRSFKILTLLQSELQENIGMMSKFHEDVNNNYFPVRTESWNAFSDGGELQWVDDPEMINHLSIAYARIEQFTFLFEKYIDAFYFPGMQGNSNLKVQLLRNVIKSKDAATTQAQSADKKIKEKLDSLGQHSADNV